MRLNNDRIAGAALILASGATVLMMAHHPSSAHDAALGRFVHGALIGLIGVVAFGLTHMALRRGLDRPAVLAGLIAYGVGAGATIGAATINGFVVTALAARGVADRDLFLFAWEANQALARLGVVAMGAGFLLWSLGWVRHGGWAVRGLGVLGIAAGVVPIVLLGTGIMGMNLAGAMLIYALESAWIALVGFYLWSGMFTRDLAD